MTNENLRESADELRRLSDLSDRFARAFTGAMARAVRSGRSFEDTLRSIGQSLSNVALNTALKPLEGLVSSGIESLASSVGSSIGSSASPAGPVAGAPAPRSTMRSATALPPVTVNISTPDPSAFSKSQAQVATTLAGAVGRARRTI